MNGDNALQSREHAVERTRTVETARFKAKAEDGRSFDIVEMTAQEILPTRDARLDTWRSVSCSYRTRTGSVVNIEPDGTLTIFSNPTIVATRV